ncbi:MAG: RNA methyltransferase [Phycisphaerales bacterium]|nr:MAG: RNA methyltransferase [Phycisphaerales bacterium]
MAVSPILIDSLDDPRVEIFRDVRDKDLRGRDKLFMAESEMVLTRLLRTPERLHSLFLSPNKFERLAGSLQALAAHVPVYVADIDLMTEIAGFHIHRGVLAAGFRPRPEELSLDAALGHLKGDAPLTLLLAEGLTNVDNMGGMFRNAAAFGADGIVLDPTCCDPLYRKAIRVSMGHVLSIPYVVCDDWIGDVHRLKEQWGIRLIGAEVTDGAIPLWDIPRFSRLGILFGSEGHGLTGEALAACDEVCRIPMDEAVPSLNVATASAVFLYELIRPEPRSQATWLPR